MIGLIFLYMCGLQCDLILYKLTQGLALHAGPGSGGAVRLHVAGQLLGAALAAVDAAGVALETIHG